jgi:hypothetical protein
MRSNNSIRTMLYTILTTEIGNTVLPNAERPRWTLVWGGREPRAAPYDNISEEKKVIYSVHAIYWIAMKAKSNDQSQAFGT